MRSATAHLSVSVHLTAMGAFGALLMIGCPSDEAPKVVDVPDGVSTSTAPGLAQSQCDGQPDGTPCPDSRQCLRGACVFNVCGDGVRAAEEACDDGNLASGDGCSPACGFEYTQCDGGAWAKLSDGCTDATPASDAGIVALDGGCPRPIAISYSKTLPKYLIDPNTKDLDKSLTSPPYLFVGDSVDVRAKSEGDTTHVIWMTRSDQSQDPAWGTEHLTNALSPQATFTCDESALGQTFALTFLWFTQDFGHCPQFQGDLISCLPRNFVFPKFSENTALDGGLSDGAVGDTDTGESGIADAGGVRSDAQVADAASGSPFPRAACETCIKTACVDYYGVDLVGPCFRGTGFDDAFARACSDAYFCSLDAADGCGYDTQRGAVACFCGMSVTIDQCQASATNVRGLCKAEWYTATHCPTTDQNCALAAFQDRSLPAAYATFLLECQSASCEAECAR